MQLTICVRARQLGFLALLLVTVASTGCGKFGKVTGTVTYIDDKPLGAGRIYFVKEGSKEAKDAKSAELSSDGKYSIDAPIGSCKVYLATDYLMSESQGAASQPNSPLPPDMSGKMTDEQKQKMKEMNDAEAQKQAELKAKADAYRALPESYQKAESSPVTCPVHKGSQEFDVKIEAPPGWKPDLSKLKNLQRGGMPGGGGPGGMMPPGR